MEYMNRLSILFLLVIAGCAGSCWSSDHNMTDERDPYYYLSSSHPKQKISYYVESDSDSEKYDFPIIHTSSYALTPPATWYAEVDRRLDKIEKELEALKQNPFIYQKSPDAINGSEEMDERVKDLLISTSPINFYDPNIKPVQPRMMPDPDMPIYNPMNRNCPDCLKIPEAR